MIDAPLISVIVPVYNGEKYIRKCVDSILMQTYPHLEIVLVNDGSVDNSGNICDAYAKQDKRIKVIHQPNKGISAARNAGIDVACGEYISFVDSDDWIAPEFVETLWKIACKYQAPIAVVGRYRAHPGTITQDSVLDSDEIEKLICTSASTFNSKQALRMTFDNYGLFVTNKLFHRSLFAYSLFQVGLGYEDMWILYSLFQHVNKVAICNIPLYYLNCCNQNSVSRGKFNGRVYMLDYFKVTDKFLTYAKENKDAYMQRKLQRQRLAHICGFFKRMMVADFNDESVIKPLQKELRHNLWILLLHPRPLHVTAFGIACTISFPMTKWIFCRLPERFKGF